MPISCVFNYSLEFIVTQCYPTYYSLHSKKNLAPNTTQVFHLHESKEEFKGGLEAEKIFYQSIWFLNKDQFGAARLTREVVDMWLAGKLEFGGRKIDLEPPQLTAEEVASVPGGTAAMNNLDTVQFEVLERVAQQMMIKHDEHKFWMAQGGVISEEYQTLRSKHLELLGSMSAGTGSQVVSADAESQEAEEVAPAGEATEEKDSLAKLEEACGVELKVPSEVPGVELLLGKDNSVWLLSSADKKIHKHTQVGGFGTGQYVPAEGEEGLEFKLPSGDRSFIQLDESSWKADATGYSVITLYKLLVMCESEKNITEHKVSYLTVTRKAEVEGGLDSFELVYKNRMRFKCLPQDRMSGKNFFAKIVSKATDLKMLVPVFRFRYERVGATVKLQKPHMVTKGLIQLKAGKPLKVS